MKTNKNKEREITIKVIQTKQINSRKLADYFAQKYSEEKKSVQKRKS